MAPPIRITSVTKSSTKITIPPDRRLPVSLVAKSGHILHTQSGKSIKLGAVLGEGGEGSVFNTNTAYVAKIYKPEKTTTHKLAKLQALHSKGICEKGICIPKALLYNSKNEFVGYLMDKADGVSIRNLYIKPLLQKKFPTWTKRDLVELCMTILQKIDHLHSKGIILGDINPENILVKTPREVYFVDCDSYQVNGYPCPVGTVPFTPPENQKKGHYSSYLRTLGNENFSIAVLLFSLMVTGQMPYNQKDGDGMQQNIIDMDFSYPFGESTNKKTPDGPWRFMWSHLPRFMKEAFYNTFSKDGSFSTEFNRLGTGSWLRKFKEYLDLLDTGKFGMQDKMSESIYPTRFKKQKGVKYVLCNKCGGETDEKYINENGICLECRRKSRLCFQKRSRNSHTTAARTSYTRTQPPQHNSSNLSPLRALFGFLNSI